MNRFSCPGCGATYAVDDAAGRAGECRQCGARFAIPSTTADPQPPIDPAGPPVEVEPCPGCGARLTVAPADLGGHVECPGCRTVFAAAGRRAAPLPPPPVVSLDRERHEDDDPPRRRSRRPRQRTGTPGNVTAIAAMLLGGGIYAVVHNIGAVFGSVGVCCLWPGVYVSLVWAVLAIVRASAMLGAHDRAGPPKTLLILQIVLIVNFDVINCVMGIVGLCLLQNADVQDFFAGRTRDRDD